MARATVNVAATMVGLAAFGSNSPKQDPTIEQTKHVGCHHDVSLTHGTDLCFDQACNLHPGHMPEAGLSDRNCPLPARLFCLFQMTTKGIAHCREHFAGKFGLTT